MMMMKIIIIIIIIIIILREEYFRRLILVLSTESSAKNKVQVSVSLTGPVLMYSCRVINLHQETLTKLDRKARKLLAIHGHYHNKADVDSCHVSRKRGRRQLIQLKEAYIAAITRLMEYA